MTEGKKSVEIKAGIEPELKKAEKFEQQLAASVSKAVESAIARAFEKALKGVGSKMQAAINDTVQRTPVEARTKRLTGAAYAAALRADAVKRAEFREYIRATNPPNVAARKYKTPRRMRTAREDAFDNLDLSGLATKEEQEDALWRAYDKSNYQKPDTNDYMDTPVSRALTKRAREDRAATKRTAQRVTRERNQEAKEQARVAREEAKRADSLKKKQDDASNQQDPNFWREKALTQARRDIARYQGGYSATPPRVTPQIADRLRKDLVPASDYQVINAGGGSGGDSGGGIFGSFGKTLGAVTRGYAAYQLVRTAGATAGGLATGFIGGGFGGGAPMYFDGLSQIPLYGNLAGRGGAMLGKYQEFNNLQNLAAEFRSSEGPAGTMLTDSARSYRAGVSYLLNDKQRVNIGIRNRATTDALALEARSLGDRYDRLSEDVLRDAGAAAESRSSIVAFRDQVAFMRGSAQARALGVSPEAYGALSDSGIDDTNDFITRMLGSMTGEGNRFGTYRNFNRIAGMAGGIAQAGVAGGFSPVDIGELALATQRNGNMLSSMNFEASLRDKGIALASQGGGNYHDTLYAMLSTITGQEALANGGTIGVEAYGRMMQELESGEGLSALSFSARKMFGSGVGANLLSASVLGGTYSQRQALLASDGKVKTLPRRWDASGDAWLFGKQQFTPDITMKTIRANNATVEASRAFEDTASAEVDRNLILAEDAAKRFAKSAQELSEGSAKMLPSLLAFATFLEDFTKRFLYIASGNNLYDAAR